MPKCPRCGSAAQVREWNFDYCCGENGLDEIIVFSDYHCGCGCYFTGTRTYHIDGEEEIEEGRRYEND